MTESLSRRESRTPKTKRKRKLVRSPWLWSSIGIVIILLATGAWLGAKVLEAKNELEAAQAKIGDLTAQAASLDIEGSLATFDEISEHTDKAVAASNDPIWRAAEWVP